MPFRHPFVGGERRRAFRAQMGGLEGGSLDEYFWNPGRCLLALAGERSRTHDPSDKWQLRPCPRAGQPRHQARKLPPPGTNPKGAPLPPAARGENRFADPPHTKAALRCLSGPAGRLSRSRASEQRHTTQERCIQSSTPMGAHTTHTQCLRRNVAHMFAPLLLPLPLPHDEQPSRGVPWSRRARAPNGQKQLPVVIALAPALTWRTSAHVVEHGPAVRGHHWLARSSQPSLVPPFLER